MAITKIGNEILEKTAINFKAPFQWIGNMAGKVRNWFSRPSAAGRLSVANPTPNVNLSVRPGNATGNLSVANPASNASLNVGPTMSSNVNNANISIRPGNSTGNLSVNSKPPADVKPINMTPETNAAAGSANEANKGMSLGSKIMWGVTGAAGVGGAYGAYRAFSPDEQAAYQQSMYGMQHPIQQPMVH